MTVAHHKVSGMSVRTLVVDDSSTMRAIVSRTLEAEHGIEVVGTAGSADEARRLIKDLNPDVVTLDVEMPGMDGIDFLDRIMRLRPMPVVMLSTLTAAGTDTSLRALEIGAFDCVAKRDLRSPEGVAALAEIVRGAARYRPPARQAPQAVTPAADYRPRDGAMIAIGSSTGGVEALIELLKGFPATCPPTMIVQHMPPDFTTRFAARLDRLTLPTVVEATSGAMLKVGTVYLAPGGLNHLELTGRSDARRCLIVPGERVNGHRPSVDRLFATVARIAGGDAVGAILTGMGNDGAAGLKQMRDAGALTIGQDEATSVVYGMPMVAHQIGAVTRQLPLRKIAAALLEGCRA